MSENTLGQLAVEFIDELVGDSALDWQSDLENWEKLAQFIAAKTRAEIVMKLRGRADYLESIAKPDGAARCIADAVVAIYRENADWIERGCP